MCFPSRPRRRATCAACEAKVTRSARCTPSDRRAPAEDSSDEPKKQVRATLAPRKEPRSICPRGSARPRSPAPRPRPARGRPLHPGAESGTSEIELRVPHQCPHDVPHLKLGPPRCLPLSLKGEVGRIVEDRGQRGRIGDQGGRPPRVSLRPHVEVHPMPPRRLANAAAFPDEDVQPPWIVPEGDQGLPVRQVDPGEVFL